MSSNDLINTIIAGDLCKEINNLQFSVDSNEPQPQPLYITFKQGRPVDECIVASLPPLCLPEAAARAEQKEKTAKRLTAQTLVRQSEIVCQLKTYGLNGNPAQPVETRSTTDYKAIVLSPQQTLATIQALPSLLHRILVLTCAATALRS